MFTVRRTVFFILACAIALIGCTAKQDVPGAVTMTDAEHEAWEIRLVEHRIDKNESFMDPAQTPLMDQDLPTFVGLNYYWPKAELRFRTKLVPDTSGATITLEKRKGELVEYKRKGTVSFTHLGIVHSLGVFGPADVAAHGDYLFLPFYDATSGEETFAGGRYLDIEIDDEGMIELDFNFAYNPLCDYNHEKFNCTLPPAENTLNFALVAGEKLFRLEE
jgi:hypothetical protein